MPRNDTSITTHPQSLHRSYSLKLLARPRGTVQERRHGRHNNNSEHTTTRTRTFVAACHVQTTTTTTAVRAFKQELSDEQIDRQLGLASPDSADKKNNNCGRAGGRGGRTAAGDVPERGTSLGAALKKLVRGLKTTPVEARAIQWHLAHLEYGCGCCCGPCCCCGAHRRLPRGRCAASLERVSLTWWDQDDAQASLLRATSDLHFMYIRPTPNLQAMLGDHAVLSDLHPIYIGVLA